jgi:hypothetical protein
LAMVRCLSCWRVSARAERPWLISVGRSAVGRRQGIVTKVVVRSRKREIYQHDPSTTLMDIPSSKPSKFFSRYVFAL